MGVVTCLDKDVVACCYEDVVPLLDNNDKDYFDVYFSFQNPWYSFLRGPWVGNVYSTMII